MQRFATNDSWNVLLGILSPKEIGFCLEDTQGNIKNKMSALAIPFFIVRAMNISYLPLVNFIFQLICQRVRN